MLLIIVLHKLTFFFVLTNSYDSNPIFETPIFGPSPAYSRESGWPSPEWKAALLASLDPNGAPVDVQPIFDEYYLLPYGPTNVTILIDPNFVNYEYASNMLPFLYLSGVENVFFWQNGYDYNEFTSATTYSNALLIPGYYEYFDLYTQDLIRAFVSNGGYLVSAGGNGAEQPMVSSIFGIPLYIWEPYYDYPPFGAYERPYYYFPDGFNLVANRVYNDSLFDTNYQRPYLPSFPTSRAVIRNAISERDLYTFEFIDDYCPYVFEFTTNYVYCGVWSKSYGSGKITVLSNSFKDK